MADGILDYRLQNVISPMQAAMSGFQGIQQMALGRQQSKLLEAQRAAEVAQTAKVQADIKRAEEMRAAFGGLAEKEAAGIATPQDYRVLSLQFPDFAEQIRATGGVADEASRKARFENVMGVLTPLSIGKPEQAISVLETARVAAENSGDQQKASLLAGQIELIRRDPDVAKAQFRSTAYLLDPDTTEKIEAGFPSAPAKEPENVRSARAYAETFGAPGTPEYLSAFREALVRPPAPAAVVNVGGPGGLQLTPGQEAIDKKFADTYLSWIDGGGSAAASRIATLNSAVERLSSGQPLTGPVVGITPEFAEAWLNPQATALRQDVQSAVVEGLRQALGAQFTEKEGTRLLNLAFDRTLPPAENKKRVQRLIAATQAALDAKGQAVRYFEDNGTMQGYRYRAPSVADFEAAVQGRGPLAVSTRALAARNFTTMSDDALLRLDPQRLSREELDSYNRELDRRGFD